MKNTYGISFLFLLLLSCINPSTSSNENQKIVERYYELFNKHQWEEMAKMYSEKALFKDPSLGTGIIEQNRAQIAKKYGELEALFPDVHDSIIQLYPTNTNHIVAEFVSTGTAPDNTKFTLPICTIFTIENGLITKDFTYYNNFEAAASNGKQ
ncbi:MAG: nuclear transport factor 2 family protein [Flavobacterium sp.]|jgi:hypothetical protein|nr:MAG: nuclear transport factor 2 family protein [Flavobacterium sp.]